MSLIKRDVSEATDMRLSFVMKFDRAINEEFRLTEIRDGDERAYIDHMANREISDSTLNIPFPYGKDEAIEWIGIKKAESEQNGRPVTFAIRDSNDYLVGSVGFDGLKIGESDWAELGYWLAKPYWGKGLMTLAVEAVCKIGFSDFRLRSIKAHVFVSNIASQKVLKKNKFEKEAYLERHFLKNGEFTDAFRFGLIKKK